PHKNEEYKRKKIYYALTEDFEKFSDPEILYENIETDVIDSCTARHNGKYYCFVKFDGGGGIYMLESDKSDSGYSIVEAFQESSPEFSSHAIEAPTIFRLPDGKWCLLLDFYGTENKDEQGYIPFLSDDIASGVFHRASDKFDFPYGFKHGTVIEIIEEEYELLLNSFPRFR
ncbi:MAG: hypothetical protein PQJ50_13985, partial [Spirochaetales bacterium]|nr:hypothetical protein [Spirochaetales bacterium]